MKLLYIVWDVSPYIFSIGKFQLGWYGFLFMLGFALAYLLMRHVFIREGIKLPLLDILSLYIFFATLIGARLGHVFFYDWGYYKHHIAEIFMPWKGGLASHGATLFIILAVIIFTRKYKLPMLWLFDRMCIVVPVVAACIRLGNLMNSEIYGISTQLPWGFIFMRDPSGGGVPHHPTQIYEALTHLATFVLLFFIWKRNPKDVKPGLLTGLLLIIIFSFRFLIEYIKNDQMPFEQGMLLNMGQWLSIPFILLGLLFLFLAYRKKVQR